jgi:hypothetical protein
MYEYETPRSLIGLDTRMCGCCNDTTANAMRDFCPERRWTVAIPEIQKLPMCWWYTSSIFPGDHCLHMVFRKVTTALGGQVRRHGVEWTGKVASTRSLPLRLRAGNESDRTG